MPNRKYSQVSELLAAGQLNWATDDIRAWLLRGALFNSVHKKLSQTGGTALFSTPIEGRYVADGLYLGMPAFFGTVSGPQAYQLIVVQDISNGDPNLLAWYDVDDHGDSLLVEHSGTLEIQPTALETIPNGTPSAPRVWMKVP